MELTHYSYLILALISLNILPDIHVEGISFPFGLGATYFGSEVYADQECHKAVHQKFNSPCYVAEGVEFLCDHKEFLRCSNGTCVCFRGYSYNSIREKCELTHSENLVRRKREPGKALPDETCYLSGDCVVGLYCIHDKCKCPDPCKYEKDEGICDCGEVNLEFPVAAKILTAVLSLLSICMWAYFIRKTKNKKKNTQNNADRNVDENVPLEMDPLNQSNKPDLVGHDNFQVPPYPPPSYQASIDERKYYPPSYSLGSAPTTDTSAWNVTPTIGPPNTNTVLTSECPVSTPYSYGATYSGISNDGISSSSVLSPENVTSKVQEASLPYPVSTHVTNPLPQFPGIPPTPSDSNQGASLPYPISSQNVSTSVPPYAGVFPTSSDAAHTNTSEETYLPYVVIPPTVPSAPSVGVPSTTSTPNTSEGAALPYFINPLNVSQPQPPLISTGAPSSAPSDTI